MSAVDDEELRRSMVAGLGGDSAAYHAALAAIAVRIRRYVSRRLDHGSLSGDVEDVVQTVLIALHSRRDTYDPSRPLMPWVYGIARYKLLSHLRSSRGRLAEITLNDFEETLSDDASANVSPAAAHDTATMLNTLPSGQREALVMTKIQGLSVNEAAAATGLSEGAVKLRVHRAMKALRRLARDTQRDAEKD